MSLFLLFVLGPLSRPSDFEINEALSSVKEGVIVTARPGGVGRHVHWHENVKLPGPVSS